jgi:hypothetical protein
MTPLLHATTAKILLFIALALGPANPTLVYCTSHNENYTWTPQPYGWHLQALGFPPPDFTRDPSTEGEFSGTPHKGDVPDYVREITHHDWSHNSAMYLSNGNRVEKRGDHVLYITNPGAPNEKDYTIFYQTKS